MSAEDLEVLLRFLEMPLDSPERVFEGFSSIAGHEMRGCGSERFLYVPGSRKNRVLLVAHADTYWDSARGYSDVTAHQAVYSDGIVRSSHEEYGLGADDRAGCAMLWLLRDLGHSLLVTGGEESGGKGSSWLMNAPENSDVAAELNATHQFVVQLDRRNGTDFKCYSAGTDDFRHYVRLMTGYSEPDRRSYTDIVTICRDIAGVNLSIGYHHEHTCNEYLVCAEWENTLSLCRRWLSGGELPRFVLSGGI